MAAALLFTLISPIPLFARLSPKCLGEKRAQHVEGSSPKVLSHIWSAAHFFKPSIVVFSAIFHKFCIICYFIFFYEFYYFFAYFKTFSNFFPFIHS